MNEEYKNLEEYKKIIDLDGQYKHQSKKDKIKSFFCLAVTMLGTIYFIIKMEPASSFLSFLLNSWPVFGCMFGGTFATALCNSKSAEIGLELIDAKEILQNKIEELEKEKELSKQRSEINFEVLSEKFTKSDELDSLKKYAAKLKEMQETNPEKAKELAMYLIENFNLASEEESCLAIPNNIAFEVSPDKADEFLSVKTDSEAKAEFSRKADEIKKQIQEEQPQVKKLVRKPNKKEDQ